jgi:hypothetical protein
LTGDRDKREESFALEIWIGGNESLILSITYSKDEIFKRVAMSVHLTFLVI